MALDQLQRFIFDHSDVRGEIIALDDSYRQILASGNHPETIKRLLGELVAATGLLSATMKFDGILTLQARGDGDLSLLVADCTRQHQLRGLASLKSGANPDTGDLRALLGNGHLAMTVDPARGERYQGIVPLEGDSLASCIESYFRQSEQLPTRLWLFCDGARAGGLLLQALPVQEQSAEARDEYWQHLSTLADTLTAGEFLATNTLALLQRLFHQEPLRLFDPQTMNFGCTCSESRTATMLRSLGEDEVRDILREEGKVEVNCQFCGQQYRFSQLQIDDIFSRKINTIH